MAKKRRSRAFKESSQIIDIEEVRRQRNQKRKEAYEKKKAKEKTPNVSERRAIKIVRHRLVYTAAFFLIAVLMGLTVYNLVSLSAAEQEEMKRQDALLKEQARLEEQLLQVNSEEYIEEQARTQLHMIKSGEKIYIVPKNASEQEEQDNEEEKDNTSKSVVPQ
ncbi:MAG: septum formation initiator family protein [Anaerovorax sp.]|nr:septum formation initiator family protein [Anaerovorax sp.]